MRINSLQEGILRRLRDDGPLSAYRVRASLNSLNALSLKKLVTADKSAPGAFCAPRTHIKWSVTEAGKQLVAHLDKDGLPTIPNGELREDG